MRQHARRESLHGGSEIFLNRSTSAFQGLAKTPVVWKDDVRITEYMVFDVVESGFAPEVLLLMCPSVMRNGGCGARHSLLLSRLTLNGPQKHAHVNEERANILILGVKPFKILVSPNIIALSSCASTPSKGRSTPAPGRRQLSGIPPTNLKLGMHQMPLHLPKSMLVV